jgi:hypothetical protein
MDESNRKDFLLVLLALVALAGFIVVEAGLYPARMRHQAPATTRMVPAI